MPSPTIDELRRRQIIDATLASIATKGAAHITIREIAAASGFSNGGLAHYYRSKQQLFEAAFTDFFAQAFARAERELAAVSDPVDKLLGFGAFFDPQDPHVALGYPLMVDCMSLAVHDPRIRELFEQWLEGWTGLLRGAIEDGVDAGVFREIDADAVARTISAIYQGLSVRWYLGGEANSDAWAKAAFREVITALLAPYRVAPIRPSHSGAD